jgi:hypothetical protein
VVLLVAVYLLWPSRFERAEGYPILQVEDLRNTVSLPKGAEWIESEDGPGIRLRVLQGDPPSMARFEFPGLDAIEFLHLKFRVSAKHLGPGKEIWEDGRCIIEWHPKSAAAVWENDLFCAVRHDQEAVFTEMVVKPQDPPAIPALRLENLGSTGDLELFFFEATVVKERLLWKIGKWILVGCWLAWAIAWIKGQKNEGIFRPLLAAGIWVIAGIYFAVPGPWSSYRSFGSSFYLGEAANGDHLKGISLGKYDPQSSNKVDPAAPIVSVGKMTDKGDLALRIKVHWQKARPFLHIALLFGPTLLIACLVGRRPACALAIILSIGIELAQFSFGFGFDAWDVLDLTCDGLGIAVAIILHRRCQLKWPAIFHA